MEEGRAAGLWGPDPLQLTVPGTRCRNPAFDVTPAALVTVAVPTRRA